MTMPPRMQPPGQPLPVDEDALDRLSRAAQGARSGLAALARREGLTPEEAVDCVQDGLCTFLDLIQSGQVDQGSDPGPLLATIVRNAARNRRRRHFLARPHVAMETQELVDAERTLPDDLLSRAEDTVRLRSCVAQLCDIQRAVVSLRLLDERAGEDVAQLLGVSQNHVAVLLHRAKSALRDCMSADGSFDEL